MVFTIDQTLWIFFMILSLSNAKLLYPPVDNIAIFKPVALSPSGSICGLELKDTLCDNRVQDDKSCSNSSSLFYCDQTCPYGNVLQSLNKIEQLKLEIMNPCLVIKDFNTLLSDTDSGSKFSYYFDKNNNLCNKNDRVVRWRPFSFESNRARPVIRFINSRTSSLSILDSGFTVSLWFNQTSGNNGTLLTIVNDVNSTVFVLRVDSEKRKISLSYICSLKIGSKLCFLEIEARNLRDIENFMAIRIFKNTLDIFINEPTNFNRRLSINSKDLNFDFGSYLVNNTKLLNFYIGTDLNGENKYFGWIQDFRIFLIPLVNVEIAELYGKINDKIKIQSECRCPNDLPRNENENSTFCVSNKVEQFSLHSKKLRLNEFAHPLSFLNDDDFKTSWISCVLTASNPIEVTLDLSNGVYIVQRIEVFFSSLPPTLIIIERFYNQKWIHLRTYSTECDSTNTSCDQLPQKFEQKIFGGYTLIWSANTENEERFFSNQTQVEAFKASKLRFKMMGYYSNIRRDIRQLYYAINELRVRGRCDCNGYSSVCDTRGDQFNCNCDPLSNTSGPMCNQCKPLYNNKAYQTRYLNSSAVCSKCDCNNQSAACVYDQQLDSGSCLNCLNNTFGTKCEKCANNFFLNKFSKKCEKCDCDLDGVRPENASNYCDQSTGLCICKQFVEGPKCDKCKPGYFDFSGQNSQGCTKCDCNLNATQTLIPSLALCDEQTGQCNCVSPFVQGKKCDICMESMFNLFQGCKNSCNCDPIGSLSPTCDKLTGKCICKQKIRGLKCDLCEDGFYNLTSIGCVSKCNCNLIGSVNQTYCNPISGQCICKMGYAGKNCETCINGYWKSNSECVQCKCNLNGILNPNNICEQTTGKCICNELSVGFSCDTCKPGYWGLTDRSNTCQKCECDGLGTNNRTLLNGNYICDSKTSQCACNKNRIGIRCETCAVGFFFLNLNNIDCLECNCDPVGSIPGSNCDGLTGECVCKLLNGIGGTRCDQCLPGFFNFSRTTGSCSTCNCNKAGSLDQECDQFTGQCFCKTFVTGTKCNVCVPGTSNLDLINPFGCSKSPSKQSPPHFSIKNANSIFVSWSPPDYPNGIIRYYLVFRNETLVSNTTKTSYEDTVLQPFTVYGYRIQSFNDQGNTSSRTTLVSIIFPGQPCCKFDFRLFNIRSSEADLIWTIPEKLNGLNLLYFIRVYRKIDITKHNSVDNLLEQVNSSFILEHNQLIDTKPEENNFFQYKISNLFAYTLYFVSIKACNRDLTDLNKLYCLEGIPVAKTDLSNYSPFITSQNRPELQPEPVLISINASYVVLGVNRPLRPNGIILLYEIWIKSLSTTEYVNSKNFYSDRDLACAIEDLYDPNDQNSFTEDNNKPKICVIKNLISNFEYGFSATSSSVIGRSELSPELNLTTYENFPICQPQVLTAESYESDSVYFYWLPSYNMTRYDAFWKNCIGGNVKNFSIFQFLDEVNKTLIYSGLENSFNLTRLNSSTEYKFKVEFCNGVACLSSKLLNVITIDPPPNPWSKNTLKYTFLNSSSIQFDWSSYLPFNSTLLNQKNIQNKSEIYFRLERSSVSFAYPPTPLETGIRFHGFNYFKFSALKYFPEGFPYFGLKYSFKTQKSSSLVYFAASSYAQSELSFSQLYLGTPWFISNTQSSQSDSCSIYLNPETNSDKTNQVFNNNEWNSLKIFRLNNYAYLKSKNLTSRVNSSLCTSQVITDVTGVFIGGLPDNYITRDETGYLNTEYKLVQRNRFLGCLKNISALVEFDNIKFSPNSNQPASRIIDFDFNDAELALGEPEASNTIYGCPLNLDDDSKSVYLLGNGFLYANLQQTMPITFQSNAFLIIDFDFRTEWSTGLLFFNFDIENNQFFIVRLLSSNSIEINIKTKVRYDSANNTSDRRYSNFFDLYFNETFQIESLNNGYWSNLNIKLNFDDRTLLLMFNNTRIGLRSIINNSSIPIGLDQRILNQSLLFVFYFNVQFYFGGYDISKLDDIFQILAQSWINPNTRKFFLPLFRLFLSFDTELYFTGCMKNMKINSFAIDFSNLNNIIEYKNVRFDGCPNLENLSLKKNLPKIQKNKIDSIYEGSLFKAQDTSFMPFTEYFYRVVAFNSQGKSSSDWILIRSPESPPEDTIEIEKYLKTEAISGYKIRVDNISNFCFYCNTSNRMSTVFKGIITNFVLVIKEVNQTLSNSRSIRNYTFFCETACSSLNQHNLNQSNLLYENLFMDNQDQNSRLLYIDTTPITRYSLSISVCNSVGCVSSEPVYVTTLGEVPDGLYTPTLLNRTSDSLNLHWLRPKYPSGNITGYILRMSNSNKESVVYFGLGNEFRILNLIPLSNYSFTLEACNSIGCARSSVVSFSTAEMAPSSVQTPTILKVTQEMIILKWNKPNNDQIRYGFLAGYILYVGEKEYLFNMSVYNISTCNECASLVKDLSGLVPGTEYLIVLSACTYGGCTNSSELKVKTLESLPNVEDILVKSVEKTSSSILVEWNKPKRPNGQLNKYILYKNDLLIYEGLRTQFRVENLLPNSYFLFNVEFCNSIGCSSTKAVSLSTDEAKPEGSIQLEAQAMGSNQIQMKWFSDPDNPLKQNGHVLFSVYVNGPFLIDLKRQEIIQMIKNQTFHFTNVLNLNLLNTTIYNTKYGILDRILPFSVYIIQVNASNSKGFILSNRVKVETFKSNPELIIPPQIVYSKSKSLKVEWYEPILLNSEDEVVFYQLTYRIKRLWDLDGPILEPIYNNNIISIFQQKTLATSYTLTNLEPYTAYSFQLTASNLYGESKSDWSEDYLTSEEIPRLQSFPKIVNLTSKSVFIEWRPALISNGLITFFRVNIHKYTNKTSELSFVNVIKLKSNITELNVTHLEPFTFYQFYVESCNSIGCVKTFTDEVSNHTLARTDPASPEHFNSPVCNSPNPYSIEIQWKMPLKPNGIITKYILERIDHSLPLSIQNGFEILKNRKYLFEASNFRFLDNSDIESCGLYSYRLFAFNQAGNTSTTWLNCSAQVSKPLIVTPPVVNIINSNSARFEWITPLTHCSVKTYILSLKPENEAKQTRTELNNLTQTVLITNLIPFTVYSVTLTSCVGLISDACTSSLTKTFRTPGNIPQGLSRPVARLVSPRAISIEWLEPLFKNGDYLKYQLIRSVRTVGRKNRTENVYSGQDIYYLDMKIRNSSVYEYRVIYGNEFGSSFSEWSNEIKVELSDIDESLLYENGSIKLLRMNFNLNSDSLAPTSVYLTWKLFQLNELFNFVIKLMAISSPSQISKYENFNVLNQTIEINDNRGEFVDFLLSTGNDSIKISKKLITNLLESTEYTFKVCVYISFNVVINNKPQLFKIVSESVKSVTQSTEEAFGDSFLSILDASNSYLNISYNLTNTLINNYNLYELSLNRQISITNEITELIGTKLFFDSNGYLSMGPYETNFVYLISLKACSSNLNQTDFKKYDKIFQNFNCIISNQIVFSLSTKPPEKISDLSLVLIEPTSIQINWEHPLNPNDYNLSYLIYRRLTCNPALSNTQNPCLDDDEDKVCCDGIYYKKVYGYDCCDRNYLPRGFNHSTECCGGKFYRSIPGYECCAGKFYVFVPDGQVCCQAKLDPVKEIRVSIGAGDSCCDDEAYFRSSFQYCCNNRLLPLKIDIGGSQIDENKCYIDIKSVELTPCQDFGLIFNQTSLKATDTGLDSVTSYDYKYCARNSYNQTCSSGFMTLKTNLTLPANFSYFKHEIINENSIFLSWNLPLYLNGPMTFFRLYRNEIEVYRGLNFYFNDKTRHIHPFQAFKYELEACNQLGCVMNDKTLLVSTLDKVPEGFESPVFNTSFSTIQITWKLPAKLNGALEKFIVNFKEINMELVLKFSFKSSKTVLNVSANCSSSAKEYFLSSQSVYSKNSVYSIILKDLVPNSQYSLKISACNSAGCVSTPLNSYHRLITDDYYLSGFQNPVVYVIDENKLDLVWNEPKQKNGKLTMFKLYRNNMFLVEFNLESNLTNNLDYKLGFFRYRDKNLELSSVYSYKIEASNQHFRLMTENVIVQTPPGKFVLSQCLNFNSNLNTSNILANTIFISSIRLFNIISIDFKINSSNAIEISYKISEWRYFIACLSTLSYENLNSKSQNDKSTFTIKILLQSSSKGLQSIDFPYPSQNETNMVKLSRISGLIPFNNYSIRISFSTVYPSLQTLTSDAIYLQTFEQVPCCVLNPPIAIRQNFSKLFSIRWKAPSHPNGALNKFKLVRSKIKGSGCIKDQSQIESITEFNLNVFNETFFYDQTNSEFVYIDSDSVLLNNFSYYSYKIIASNSIGSIESNWSLLTHSFELKPPSPPYDFKITQVHSTGFKIRFKEPMIFNGILGNYKVKINPLVSGTFSSSPKDRVEIVLEAAKKCKLENSQDSFIDVPINGLDSFKTFKVTITAINRDGVESKESEFIITNTLESTPKYLRPMLTQALDGSKFNSTTNILFKFYDPDQLNGVLTSFNLYNRVNHVLKLIYSGLSREFLYTGLEAYTNYSFLYEACTYVSCTRQAHPVYVQTLESLPQGQHEPVVLRLVSNLNCFKISWRLPLKQNGVILKFEIYRLVKLFGDVNFSSEVLIKNVSILDLDLNTGFTAIDCDLKSNFVYSYRIVSYNSRGGVSSRYSEPLVSNLSLPEGFFQKISATELNTTLIKIEWQRPKFSYGNILSYKIFRNSSLIADSNFSQSLNLAYFDSFDSTPNMSYKYDVYACNDAGCSTSHNYSVILHTKQQPPLQVKKPTLIGLSPYTAILDASLSVFLKSNQTQTVVQYKFYLNNVLVHEGDGFIYTIEKLSPYTTYRVSLEACTLKNICLKSKDFLEFQTNQSEPAGLSDLKFYDLPIDEINLNINVTWYAPARPNGILRQIELKRDNIQIFLTKNIFINSFTDFNLNYGKVYTYELKFYNDVGHIGVVNSHLTIENLPMFVHEPTCKCVYETEIELIWSKPGYSNGIILNYELKFKRVSAFDWKIVKVVDQREMFLNYRITDLKSFTQYEFQIGACNKVGCGYSNVMRDSNCTTLETVPIEMGPPEIEEIEDLNSGQVDLLIKWRTPKDYFGRPLLYILSRIIVQSSIAFDSDFNPILGSVLKKEVYTGQGLSFIDKNIGSFNTFDYFIEARSTSGSSFSSFTRHRTSPSEPKLLIMIGSILHVTNQSVFLNLKPPLLINGQLRTVFVVLKTESFQKEIEIYSSLLDLDSFGLIKYLSNVSVIGLSADSTYEIKTKYCNQVACLSSLQAFKFRTLINDQIESFDAVSLGPANIELKWNFRFGNPSLTRDIKYQLRYVNFYSSLLIYEGLLNQFSFDSAKPYTEYKFELLALNYQEKNQYVLDRKMVTVTTLPDKPVFKEFPIVNLISYENNTALLNLDWKRTFLINGPLKHYELFINDQSVYSGIEHRFELILNISDCYFDKSSNYSQIFVNGYFLVNIQIHVENTFYKTTSSKLTIPSNCSIDETNTNTEILGQKNSISAQPWFLVLMFIIGIFLIFVFVMSFICCISRTRNYSTNLSSNSNQILKRDLTEDRDDGRPDFREGMFSSRSHKSSIFYAHNTVLVEQNLHPNLFNETYCSGTLEHVEHSYI